MLKWSRIETNLISRTILKCLLTTLDWVPHIAGYPLGIDNWVHYSTLMGTLQNLTVSPEKGVLVPNIKALTCSVHIIQILLEYLRGLEILLQLSVYSVNVGLEGQDTSGGFLGGLCLLLFSYPLPINRDRLQSGILSGEVVDDDRDWHGYNQNAAHCASSAH